MNLHDVVALERLPQLTSTPGERGREVESPVVQSQDIHEVETSDLKTRNSRDKDSQLGLAINTDQWKKKQAETRKGSSVTPDGKGKEDNHMSKKYRNVPENPAEDLVVLSFSSSGGKLK